MELSSSVVLRNEVHLSKISIHNNNNVCIYSPCAFFDCQADFDVDNVQRRELVNFYGV